MSSGVRQREPPHPGSHVCYLSSVPIRCPCAGLRAETVGQHFVPAAPCGTRSTEAAEGGSGGAGYAVAMTALIAAKSATTRVRSISFFTLSPFHVLLVLSAPGTYLRMRPREGRPLGTHGDVHLRPIAQTARGPSIFHRVLDGPLDPVGGRVDPACPRAVTASFRVAPDGSGQPIGKEHRPRQRRPLGVQPLLPLLDM